MTVGKVCPACAEQVKPEAVVCKHCGADLSAVEARRVATAISTPIAVAVVISAVVVMVLGALYAASETDRNSKNKAQDNVCEFYASNDIPPSDC